MKRLNPYLGSGYQVVKKRVNTNLMSRDQRLAMARAQQNKLVYQGRRPANLPFAGQQIVRRSNVGPELKGVDSNVNDASVLATTNTNAGIVVLNLVQQGNGSWNRVGKKITMKSVRIRGIATSTTINNATQIQNNVMRMTVVYDKQPSSGAIPTFDQIFGNTAQDGAETSRFLDGLRFDNTGRFQVIKDQLVTSDMAEFSGAAGLVEYDIPFDMFINLKGLDTIFSGQSNPMTIADISTGALYFIARADSSTATTNLFSIKSSTTRLRYYD